MSSRTVATTPMKQQTASRLRALARVAENTHPAVGLPGHLRDAAASLEHGRTDASKRHLRAAMNILTPQSLYRHGVQDDTGHTAARQHLAEIHRAHLAVQEIEDVKAQNDHRFGAGRSFAPSLVPGVQSGEEPQGNRAMQVPGRPPAGRDTSAARGPSSPPPAGSRQIGMSIDLVGPHGYVHGWIKVDDPAAAQYHGKMMRGAIGPGKGVIVGRYNHQTKTVTRPNTGMTYRVTHIDPTAYEAGFKTGEHLPPEVQRALNTYHPQNPSAASTAALRAFVVAGVHQLSGWDEVVADILLSAETARLAVTPAPRGRPGGPGLYDVKGMGHTAYLQQVVKALIEKRGMPPGKAYAIARASLRRWMSKSKHPEVKAAAGAAEAGELERQARAHAHSWGDVIEAIELGGPGSGNPNQQRIAAGNAGGGQFTKSGGSGPGKKGKAKVAGGGSKAAQRAHLLHEAQEDRARAHQLEQTLHALQAQQRASNRATAQATKAGSTGKTKSSTPAKKTGTAAASKSSASTASSTAASAGNTSHRISQLRQEIHQLLARAAALTAQAHRL